MAPSLPYQTRAALEAGRRWLAEAHGVAAAVLNRAEREGFVHHCPAGVAITGRDRATRLVRWAAVLPADGTPARPLPHSDPAYPAVLPGSPGRVVLCGDGVAALRLASAAHRRGEPAPTCVVLAGPEPAAALAAAPPEVRAAVAAAADLRLAGVEDGPALRAALAVLRPPPDEPDRRRSPPPDPVADPAVDTTPKPP